MMNAPTNRAITAKTNEDAARIKATAQEDAELERNKALADLRSQVVALVTTAGTVRFPCADHRRPDRRARP